MKASRAAAVKAITCSAICIGELRRRNIIAYRGSEKSRQTRCATCFDVIYRKPSQIAKYAKNYCGRECAAIGKLGVNYKAITGKYYPCGRCGDPVWRTPATLRKQVFCSMACTAAGQHRRYGPRILRIIKQCANGCGKTLRMIPSVDKIGRRFCSLRCAHQTIQGAKRGLPGRAWPAAQRAKLQISLRAKWEGDWAGRAEAMSAQMRGSGNPQWVDGRARRPYEPGFTKTLKERIARRDGYRCRICGLARGKGTHVIHHIDGEKHDHRPGNLILLCQPCHGRVHARMRKGERIPGRLADVA